MRVLFTLVKDGLAATLEGNTRYHLWMAGLTAIMLFGAFAYYIQLTDGLIVTGMSDHVSWGLYISNFTFLVGVAAAAVMVVLPTYILHDVKFKQAVLIGEGMAVAALIMCLAFIMADMGGPARFWHIIPGIGILNWPNSMLSWDVIVLNGYLFLNITIPAYILISHYQGKTPNPKIYLPGVLISVFWAVGIHLVTAFLYAGLPARPFWNNALLGPRFLASAFAAGPALIILVLELIRKHTEYKIEDKTLHKLALVVTVAAQANLIMLGSELFKEFYAVTHHSSSALYLYFGIDGKNALVPWIYTALALNVTGTVILSVNSLRGKLNYMSLACLLIFVGIWIDKGMGLIIPGFIPGQWGDIVEYSPTWVEIAITLGIWAMGAFIFTLLAKVAIRIELGRLRYKGTEKN